MANVLAPQCGASEVCIIPAASPRCRLLNQSHTGFNQLSVSFDAEARSTACRKVCRPSESGRQISAEYRAFRGFLWLDAASRAAHYLMAWLRARARPHDQRKPDVPFIDSQSHVAKKTFRSPIFAAHTFLVPKESTTCTESHSKRLANPLFQQPARSFDCPF